MIQRTHKEPMVVPRRPQQTQHQPGCGLGHRQIAYKRGKGPRGKSWPLGIGKGRGLGGDEDLPRAVTVNGV